MFAHSCYGVGLEKLIQSLNGIQKELESYGDWLDTVDREINAFNMIFNGNKLALELLGYYYPMWKSHRKFAFAFSINSGLSSPRGQVVQFSYFKGSTLNQRLINCPSHL